MGLLCPDYLKFPLWRTESVVAPVQLASGDFTALAAGVMDSGFVRGINDTDSACS